MCHRIDNYAKVRTKEKKYGILMLLLSLYVFFLYTAQETLLPTRIHSLVMYGFVGCTLAYVLLKNGGKIQVSTYSIWYAALLILCAFSFLWATNMVSGAIYNMAVSLVITFCLITVLETPGKLDTCLRVFVLSADVMGILLIATGQLTGELSEDRLGQEVAGNANAFSALMMVAAVFAVWLLIYKSPKITDRLFNLASYLFILLMMALSGGRKTVIAVVACTFFFIVFKNGSKLHKVIKNMLIAIAAVALLYNAMMTIPVLYEAIGQRFEGLFDFVGGGTSSVSSDKIREKMIEIGLKKWLDRPLLGYGVDTFKYYNQVATGHFYYAHNNYVELLYDLGLVGFLLYYGYMLKLWRSLRKSRNRNSEYKMLGMGLILQLLIFDIGGVSYYAVLNQIILCIVFLCCKFSNKSENIQDALSVRQV